MDLKELKAKSLSADEMIKALDGRCNLITYKEIYDFPTLDDLLGKYGCCIILYEFKKNYGHWVTIFRVNDHKVEFFDSYGFIPDNEFAFIPKTFQNEYYPYNRYLTKLLYESNDKVEYNHDHLQSKGNGINTCGRYVVNRLLNRNIPLKKYVKILQSDKDNSPDDIVSILTKNI